MTRHPQGFTLLCLLAFAAAVACTEAPLGPGVTKNTESGPQARPEPPAPAATSILTAGPACTGTNAHDKHGFATLGCELCHPCGGVYAIANAKISLGFQVSGTITHSTTTTAANCTVSCHNMNGGNLPAYWNAPGPLACSSCHLEGSAQAGVQRSGHISPATDAASNRATCLACHVNSGHLSGSVTITGPSGPVTIDPTVDAQVNAVCQDCHDGTGRMLLGQTPPVLPSYASATGDFHGARAGTGFGGALKAPYARGQGPLACQACHTHSSSTNAFTLAATVNGSTLPPGSIDRAGRGAEALCSSCHQALPGNGFHRGCQAVGCHTADPIDAELVPATGQKRPGACFFCHGHEGIVNFGGMPTWDSHPQFGGDFCNHCHSPGWFPTAVTTARPMISALQVAAASLTATSATITWTTNVPATTWVEWGAADQPTSQGSAALATQHSVALTGLQGGSTYTYKARSTDALRNVAVSTVRSLTTAQPGVPLAPLPVSPIPDLYPFAYLEVSDPNTLVTFRWAASASPLGNPVEYEFQLADSSAFAALRYDSGWRASLSFTTPAPGLPSDPDTLNDYFWRVRARDKVTGAASAWSSPTVELYIYNIYSW